MNEIKIKIIEVKSVETKDGKKFNAYKTVGKGGRKMDVRFVQGCQNVPTEPCLIVCEEDKCNVDTSRQYPILWVKNVERIEPIVRKNNVSEYLDVDENSNG